MKPRSVFRLAASFVFVAGAGLAQTTLPNDLIIEGDLTVQVPAPGQPVPYLGSIYVETHSVIDGNLCIGNSCSQGMSFGNDETLILQYAANSIVFNDTSGSTYPNNDWVLRVNDPQLRVDGGIDKFALEDTTAGTTPFTIEAGVPDNAFWLAPSGNLGLGTSLPQAPLHIIRSDNTAAMLIEETGAGTLGQLTLRNNGITFFTLEDTAIAAGDDTGRAWNVQNQAGAFRVTTAPGGGDDVEMVLDPGGNMTREGALNSIGDGAKLVAENNSGTTAARELMARKNNGIVYFSLEDTSLAAGPNTGRAWNFQNQSGEFRVTTEPGGPSDIEMRLTPAGDMTLKGQLFTAGSCAAGCDRVFDEDYPLPTIAEQAAMMREKKHLPNVGPTPEDGPFNITAMTGGMLNELEKAHLYIAQLETRLGESEARDRAQEDRIARLEALVAAAVGR
ncbi:hypothetical protein [Oceanicola sp. 22II-s10i]|uniref:hypothetical protein n=1 Tax=Oceanicola sp. 22II-s10i TaxID=1317116 RepID=UPI000B51F5AF|nr:hypothetical protein [Oceanicola sp. 22II-s10i]